ncbi:transposase, partial [Paraburkholderia kirstenboschensis]|uniref:transposase n=1 Tax=Paraburkholderia kirstenboschensis TaxID=1245436 RepID=UPI001F404B3B
TGDWPAPSPLIGGSISRKLIGIRRRGPLGRVDQQGTATASLILRKLSAAFDQPATSTSSVAAPLQEET